MKTKIKMANKFKIEKELWRERAACKGMDISNFFSETERQSALSRKKHAKTKQICNECPVQKNCLFYAIENNIEYGIWGGLTSVERSALVKNLHVYDYETIVKSIKNKPIKTKK